MSAYSEIPLDDTFETAEPRPVYMGELPLFYEVEEGDTLWGISHFFNIEMEVLVELNHLSETDVHRLGVGQRIRLHGEPIEPNLSMQIRLLDAVGMPIKRPRVKVFADAEWSEYVGDADGYLPPLVIEKPQYGLHIDFYNIAEQWETIHQSEVLPWGVLDLTLFSGDVLVEVPLLPLPGVQQNTSAAVKAHIDNHHKQEVAKAKQQTPVLQSQQAVAPASQPKTPVRIDTRTEKGLPSVDIAFQYVEGGLRLFGGHNENYRPLILEAAKKHRLEPWLLAALIQVECHKELRQVSSTLKNGQQKTAMMEQWDNRCSDLSNDKAQGLCQFMSMAWLDIAVNPKSALHEKLLKTYQIKKLQLGFRNKDRSGGVEITQDEHKSTDGNKYLFNENGKEIPRDEFLALRKDEALSIDAGCLYGLSMLTAALKADADFKKRYEALNEHEKHMVHYAFHNQGPAVAVFLKTAWRWVDWNERRIKEEGKRVAVGHIFEKLCALGQYKDTQLLLVSKILSVMFRPEIFTQAPEKYVRSTPANLLCKLWDGVVVTERDADAGKKVDADKLLEEIANRPEQPAVKEGLGKQAAPATQEVAAVQGTPAAKNSNFLKELGLTFKAWFHVDAPVNNASDKHVVGKPVEKPIQKPAEKSVEKAVEKPKAAPVVSRQISQKTSTDNLVQKKPVPEAEAKVSAPKYVGKDVWTDKSFCMPLKVMEIRRRDKYGNETPAVKSAWGWYRFREVKKDDSSNETKLVFKNHDGVDFAANPDTDVYNVFDGELLSTRVSGDYGLCITISHQTKDLPSQQRAYIEALGHTTFQTFYAHLSDTSEFIKSAVGQKRFFIKAGQVIAKSGCTGNAEDMPNISRGAHLHFEARSTSNSKVTFDPLPLFNPSLIKDACHIYINKHLENSKRHPKFECKKNGCHGCVVKMFAGDPQKNHITFSINKALTLLADR